MKISRSVLSVTSLIIFLLAVVATQLAMAADPFKIYELSNFKGRANNYGVGQHEFHVGGDSKTMGSFKVPAGLAVTFYDASGCKGGKSYGPFKGRFRGTQVTGSHGFTSRSIHCFKVVDVGPTKEGWRFRKGGNIIHGPGSYYLRNPSLTQRFEGIKAGEGSEDKAWSMVRKLAKKNPSNPPVMWQFTDPWDKVPGHLVVHFKKFMSMPLDASTGTTVDCYTEGLEKWGRGKLRDGDNPLYYSATTTPSAYKSATTTPSSAFGSATTTPFSDYGGEKGACTSGTYAVDVKTGGLTVGSFTSATSTGASTGKVKLYQHYGYGGIEKGYGVGDHVWIGDTYSGYLGLSSFKIPKGLSVTFYEGKGLTGKSYGPFDGALSYNCLGCAKHPMIPNDKIFSLKVTDISTKAKREEEAKKRAKLEAERKAAVAKAKAAAELAKKKEECKADVVFLMDNTGSMSSVIRATKRSAAKILNKISGADPRFKGLNVKFGVATYWGDPKEHKCETKATGVKLYQHWHYGGKHKTYKAGTYNNITGVFRGGLGVSSFKLPSGLSLYMYSKKGGEGIQYGPFDGPLDIPCLAYPGGPSCPHKHAVNDNVRSIKVEKTKGVRLYSHASYNTGKEVSIKKLIASYKPPKHACDGTGSWIVVDSAGKNKGSGGMVCSCAVCGSGGSFYHAERGPWAMYASGTVASHGHKMIYEAPRGSACSIGNPWTCSYDPCAKVMVLSNGRMRDTRGNWIKDVETVATCKSGKTGRRTQQYGVGNHASISSVFPSGSALGVSSVKVPTGFKLEMYEKANFKGKKYGPFSGSHDIKCMATDADCKHSAIPDNAIASIKVTGGIDVDEGFKECARKAYKVNQPLTKSKASAASAMKQWKACSAPGGLRR